MMERSEPTGGSEERAVSEAEAVIRELYRITADYRAGLATQMQKLLRLGRDRFQLDLGLVARIEDDTYTVVQADGEPMLAPGDQFELGKTYCSLTMAADGPIGFAHISETEHVQHPCYLAMGLEAYVGTPLYVDGKAWGTLNFSSAAPRERRFRDVDIDALQLMATWISSEIERRELVEGMKTLIGLIPICASCKQIRDELGDWNRLEAYLAERANISFSHGICPPCEEKMMGRG